MWVFIVLGVLLAIVFINVVLAILDEIKYRRMIRKAAEWQMSESFRLVEEYSKADVQATMLMFKNAKED